ncbi:DUF1146 domain-containing protein [Acholeplasma equirhinis]|uniref:DUF1146 family protein n=1 Tax=Acholeplasma equirhinis TaxID=555393 RepID=UPI00197A7771|nr:DUF1146 family protein [Acholeplasma equirhinis]MBN3490845.1 DUF1146 domain-containing protein [Acholeplasma equirhinis]
MNEFVRYIVFWTGFIATFFVVFKILQAIQIERIFKKYRLFEIQAAYIIITILCSYLMGRFLIDFIDLMPWN